MTDFIKSLFSDKDGSISSKRLCLFALLFTFLVVVHCNLFWKLTIAEGLLTNLVTLLITVLGLVFGENLTNIFKKPEPPNSAE